MFYSQTSKSTTRTLTRLPSSSAGTEPTASNFTVPDNSKRGKDKACRWEEPWVGIGKGCSTSSPTGIRCVFY